MYLKVGEIHRREGGQAMAKDGLVHSTKYVYKSLVSILCNPPFRRSLFTMYVPRTTERNESALVLRHASPRAVWLEIFLAQSH